MADDGFTWECTRCQARRYGQPNKLPDGWAWRLVYSVTAERKVPTRYDARCGKCVAKEPPPKESSPPTEPQRGPW